MKNKSTVGSKTFLAAVMLTLAGGFLDAYTYAERGGVFANAQTGNIVKLGIAAAQGEYVRCVRFLVPVIAFVIGVAVVLMIESYCEKRKIHFIRRAVLLIEMAVMIIVSFLPRGEFTDMLSNVLVSFACAMQMECFRQFIGQAFATTVGTGNLRKMVEFVYRAVTRKNKEDLKTAGQYLVILLTFVFGAYIGTILTLKYGPRTILLTLIPYGICFIRITLRLKYLVQENLI